MVVLQFEIVKLIGLFIPLTDELSANFGHIKSYHSINALTYQKGHAIIDRHVTQ